MESKEECNSNESGWTKYIDPQSEEDISFNSSVDDGDVFLHHHHTHGYHVKSGDDDEDDDSIASDASSGPSHHQHHHHDNVKYHHHYEHHGNKLLSLSGGKKSSKDEMKESTKYGNKGKESTIKTNTSSNSLKQRQGKKRN
ncbi:uncharacterized protein LOC141643301 [Silene latifolia]|uniref:uncharacterized protein LOC141643301 n=1 Tax=Silene latifolia TaxID=37657 RepID=UPI003D770A8B